MVGSALNVSRSTFENNEIYCLEGSYRKEYVRDTDEVRIGMELLALNSTDLVLSTRP